MFTHKLESAHGLQFKIKTDVVLNVAGSHVYFKSGTISKTVQDRDVVTTSVSKTDTCFSFDFFCFSHCASTDQQFTSFWVCQSNVFNSCNCSWTVGTCESGCCCFCPISTSRTVSALLVTECDVDSLGLCSSVNANCEVECWPCACSSEQTIASASSTASNG